MRYFLVLVVRRGETASPSPLPTIGDGKSGRYMTILRQSPSFYAPRPADWFRVDSIGFAWVFRCSFLPRPWHCSLNRPANARIVEIIKELRKATAGSHW